MSGRGGSSALSVRDDVAGQRVCHATNTIGIVDFPSCGSGQRRVTGLVPFAAVPIVAQGKSDIDRAVTAIGSKMECDDPAIGIAPGGK
jgi:hypothetical protein